MLVGIAILHYISSVAWYIMVAGCKFAYRINISWWMFAYLRFVAVLIAVITVNFQLLRNVAVGGVIADEVRGATLAVALVNSQ